MSGDRVTIVFISGFRGEVFTRKPFGGIVRSIGLLEHLIMSLKKIGLDNIDAYLVTLGYKSKTQSKLLGENFNLHRIKIVEIPVTLTSKVYRVLQRTLRSMGVIGDRSILTLYGRTIREISKLNDILEGSNHKVLVINSLMGYVSIRKHISRIIKKSKPVIIYLSHDFTGDFYRQGYSSKIAEGLEREICNISDLILASSIRDREQYIKHYKITYDKIIVYPNIYPIDTLSDHYELIRSKYEEPTLAIIGSRSLYKDRFFNGLVESIYDLFDRIIYIGYKAPIIDHLIKKYREMIEYHKHIPSRYDFLKTLSKAHIGLNYGLWLGGSNVKRYDYALSGLLILSNALGARGEILPCEYVYADQADLRGKLRQLLSRDLDEIIRCGRTNLDTAYSYYEGFVREFMRKISTFL